MGCVLPTVEVGISGDSPEGDASFWWAQELSLLPGHAVWIGASEVSWNQIGKQALCAIGVEGPAVDDVRDTFREILAQSLSALAVTWTARCSREVTCREGAMVTRPPETGVCGYISVKIGEMVPAPLCLMVKPELLEAFQPEGDGAPPIQERTPNPRQALGQSLSVESLLDVEIPIRVSFGTTQIGLDAMLKLKEGCTIPLGRPAYGLVDLQVNNRVMARGEIVMFRGQYGIRIHQLSTSSERWSQLQAALKPE